MSGEPVGRRTKAVLVAGVAGIVVMTLFTFFAAFPSNIDPAFSQPIAKDFSAYYVGIWRLFHDPSQLYTRGFINDGELHVYPVQEQFKYLPSFLLMISPLAILGYQQAIATFDVFQLALLPLIGLLTYRLARSKGLLAAFLVTGIVLVLPAPAPGWGLSIPYFWQWAQGQAKVFEVFLILSTFYAGSLKIPVLSGALLGLSFFDPRFGILAVPLFVMYNRSRLSVAAVSFAASLVVSNSALVLSPGMGAGFIGMVFSAGLSSVLYPYALIPTAPVLALWIMNRGEVAAAWTETFAKFSTSVARKIEHLTDRPWRNTSRKSRRRITSKPTC
jgi:MFS family permease